MLNRLLFSITPSLPTGSAGTRPSAGEPDTIPDVTFIARELTAAEEPDNAERTRLNGYIQDAIKYHKTFGLIPNTANSSNPNIIGSFEDIIDHFQSATEPYKRIRIVSHGNDQFIYLPMFNNGGWGLGMAGARLDGFAISDVAGLRSTLGFSPTASPTLMDSTATIFDKFHSTPALSTFLQPFNYHNGGTLSGDFLQFLQVVNDFYQVAYATIIIQENNRTSAIIDNQQRAIFRDSLTIIEEDIRNRLEGTTVNGSSTIITATHLNELKDEILRIPILRMGFWSATNFTATDITNINTAVTATTPTITSLRTAFNASGPTVFFALRVRSIVAVLRFLEPTLIEINGIQIEEDDDLQDIINEVLAIPDLEEFIHVAADLFYLKNGDVQVAGSAINTTQRTTLRNGLLAIADLLMADIVQSSSVSSAELIALRDRIENFTIEESTITGWQMYPVAFVNGLRGANTSLKATPSFRTKYNIFRGLSRSDSIIDIRGCLVGKTPSFLDKVSNFVGQGANLPIVTAPEWFQMFPTDITTNFQAQIYSPHIDDLVASGFGVIDTVDDPNSDDPADTIDVVIDGDDVTDSFGRWKDLIDFQSHYDFITDLFDTSVNANDIRFEFASLAWRTFNTGGIPILKIETERIDDLNTLNLGQIIERFGVIFEIPDASKPSGPVRTRLTDLQPHLVVFKSLHEAITNASSPNQTEIDQFVTQISSLVTAITGISGFTAPSTPIVPSPLPGSVTHSNVETYAGNLRTYIDGLLNTDLDAFFTAIEAQIGHTNAEIRYCFNIGSPIIIKSESHPPRFKLVVMVNATSNPGGRASLVKAIKAWMKIQWQGSSAHSTDMNNHINGLSINANSSSSIAAAARSSMLVETEDPASDSAINPFEEFQDHIVIVTRP